MFSFRVHSVRRATCNWHGEGLGRHVISALWPRHMALAMIVPALLGIAAQALRVKAQGLWP